MTRCHVLICRNEEQTPRLKLTLILADHTAGGSRYSTEKGVPGRTDMSDRRAAGQSPKTYLGVLLEKGLCSYSDISTSFTPRCLFAHWKCSGA